MGNLYGFTDYPIRDLGDIVGKEAPLRKCIITGWDGDKYVDVIVSGVETNFKACYIYKNKKKQKFTRKKLSILLVKNDWSKWKYV